jgi:hypothetical protein
MIIIIDESGDLGFNFKKKKTSSKFVITLLTVNKKSDLDLIRRGVKRTLKNKIYGKKGRKKKTAELKGSKTNFTVKVYFWRQISQIAFSIQTIVLNKHRVNSELREAPDRLYNYLARFLIDKLQLQSATDLNVIIDKSKNKLEIEDFNNYLSLHLKAVIDPKAILDIDHSLSHEEKAIQAVDMFAWGIFRKYEERDTKWYNLFKRKIAFEEVYLR